MLDSYMKYQEAIVDEFCNLNENIPTDGQLRAFIVNNQLDAAFGISLEMVRADYISISHQYTAIKDDEYRNALELAFLPIDQTHMSSTYINNFIKKNGYDKKFSLEAFIVHKHIAQLCSQGFWIKKVLTPSHFFKFNSQYKLALLASIKLHAPYPLTETQIKIFVKRNMFGKLYGVRIEDVRNDMYTLNPEFQPPVFIPKNMSQSTSIDQIKDTIEVYKGDCTMTNQMNKYDFKLKTDIITEGAFIKLLINYSDRLGDRKIFNGLVKDFFMDKPLQANLILALYDMKIREEISSASSISKSFAFRFAKKLMDEHGTSRKNADWAVSVWCVCYMENKS